ncbi:MAG: response regulator transcription factor [Planctomycetes bacterium]|nr:response regulator transcription factor [Planctomycetota bacterium]MCB9885613.1 response regulator transcription factor [Planctomycetota bacterium]
MQSLASAERSAASALVALDATLHRARAEAEQWRTEARDLLQGLGAAIDRQLTRWQLTAAERDIAMLLLKGMSHKEIASLRNVGEATVRQQSRAIYQKAKVAGRHELAAFFLEDLVATPRP